MATRNSIYVFAAINRAQRKNIPVMLRTVASDEKSARRRYAADYILCFSCRLPVGSVI
ncbi:host cell division inhibitor Icd-like protein [Salmonella enterica]|uniref:host cell division inhibitor Icd-like protein n=1 Tax=Salmonella enterica TaxID=28901 RepID=UPI0009ABE450|nr:host cell division inhibitor Icd-like protein [Salmonella enterica]EBW3901677.1 host cell division inhibitor Icd-like protein [Salmonella enterica subsp. enterica serovar Panama]EBW6121875.1 host cell division inhibitor Icd-like protein [Salmonella enterica subsp. enterica serovar Panama]